ncbi:MAG: hypothetical protein U9O64_04355 [Campylobacterota bacterium]|nr:hypothetical protein [Campylobacterota bacterium]
MDRDCEDYIKLDNFNEKEIYTKEEKKIIMERLDEERRINQRVKDKLDGNIKAYTQEEKQQILHMLNEERLSKQKRDEIKKKRIAKKEKYKFGSKTFYKFTNMEREYYIEVNECENISGRPQLISLYYRSIDELKKKEVLIKTEVYSDQFYISYNPIRVYFKTYRLEDERKKY